MRFNMRSLALLAALAALVCGAVAQNDALPAGAERVVPIFGSPRGLVPYENSLLVTAYNEPATNGRAGAGKIVYKVDGNSATPWATIEPKANGPCSKSAPYVGLTGAISVCGGVVLVGSAPLLESGTVAPGCIIALDSKGTVINEAAGPGLNGPWGMTCSASGDQITLFVSDVGNGGNVGSATPAASINRFTFKTPTAAAFELGPATVITSNVPYNSSVAAYTNNRAGGTGRLALSADGGSLFYVDSLASKLYVVRDAFGTKPTPVPLTGVPAGILNEPAGVFQRSYQLWGANRADGSIFSMNYDPDSLAVTDGSLYAAGPGNAPGTVSNVIIDSSDQPFYLVDSGNSPGLVKISQVTRLSPGGSSGGSSSSSPGSGSGSSSSNSGSGSSPGSNSSPGSGSGSSPGSNTGGSPGGTRTGPSSSTGPSQAPRPSPSISTLSPSSSPGTTQRVSPSSGPSQATRPSSSAGPPPTASPPRASAGPPPTSASPPSTTASPPRASAGPPPTSAGPPPTSSASAPTSG